VREKNLNDKLDRFQTELKSRFVSLPSPKQADKYSILAEAVDGQLVFRNAGCYSLSKTVFPFGYQYGQLNLEAVTKQEKFPVAAFNHNFDSIEIEPESMLFVDTETTGLGGTGAVAFLIGIGRIKREGFEVSQFLIPDYSDEAAMLEDLNAEFTKESTIVSFNGASFDLPVLQDRMIINRVAREIEYKYHLDLLHPARRLFKRRLADCTLINLEKRLFSFYRADDIPGYLVPSVYFEWLADQSLSNMKLVLEHNRFDILSMYFLARVISDAFLTNGETLAHVEDLYSLSRYFERRKETNRVEMVFERVKNETGEISPDAALHYARNFKRSRKVEKSVAIWEKIAVTKSAQSYWASIELAKYYEHQRRDFKNAIHYANLARGCEPISTSQIAGVEKRVVRLKQKITSRKED
jgi:uncharacterized protein YprB with RNaseH-like and TPR domain